MKDYKTVFEEALQSIKNKGMAGVGLVEKAFLFAEEKHLGQFRKGGLPYISHPVDVMAILEKLDFSSDVLAAALLHDVVEDCGVTLAELESNFNPVVSKIVDAVTEIQPNEKLENIEAEIKTYQKLVSLGKINRFAFYIKFADRLHNLQSLSVFKRYKQIEKIKQTERFLVPLLKILKTKEFYSKITNQCFLTMAEPEEIASFKKLYTAHTNNCMDFNQKLFDDLTLAINNFFYKNKIENSLKKIIITPLTELEIKEEMEKVYDIKNVNEVKSSFFVNVPSFYLYFVFSNDKFTNLIFQLFEDKDFNALLSLRFFEKDAFSGKNFFVLQSAFRVKYKSFFFSQSEFTIYRNGALDGTVTDIIDEDFEREIISDYIRVKTKTEEILLLPKNSTVLDFAFKIHNDFGFSCKFAHLNDSPAKTPIWAKLSDGDKVDLVIETDETGMAKNIAKLKWITYVNNEKSKKMLVKYFENLFE